MTLVQKEVKRITMRPNGSEVQIRPTAASDALYFEANTAGSTIKLKTMYSSVTPVNLETSTNGVTWTDYTIGNVITLSSIGDKLYMRNKSDTTTGFSTSGGWYQFEMAGSIAAHGDITYLINKNTTDTLTADYCFYNLFSSCSVLTTPPDVPATTLTNHCYDQMFYGCTSLTKAPSLPATTLTTACYYYMFNSCINLEELPALPSTGLTNSCYYAMFQYCSKIKLSTTQTGEYQTAYRVPTTGTGSLGSNSLTYMFNNTGGTYKGISINTTYYTSNTIVG